MRNDTNGCSTCPKGEEHYEEFESAILGRTTFCQYDYRTPDGELFSCVAKSLQRARDRRDAWLSSRASR